MNISELHQLFLNSNGITTDTRNCTSNSMFFALKGESFDGNKYASKAIESGSAYAIVDDPAVVLSSKYILVSNVLQTLQHLANYHRRTFDIPVIGITGSNGKTTTKEMLATTLSTHFYLHYTAGNFNNHIGVPLTLLQITSKHQLAIIEMGANHPGEIADLCNICEPTIGLITNIGKAHLEGFGGIEGVINTKKELYDFIKLSGAYLFVNAQDELLMQLSQDITRKLYNAAESFFSIHTEKADPTLSLRVSHDAHQYLLDTQLVGDYNATNIAVALEIGHVLGADTQSMINALAAYSPSNNRSQIIKKGQHTIILDAYNANPASMSVAISNFKKLKADKKVVLLGAMKELGTYSNEEHQALVNMVSYGGFYKGIVVGNEFLNISIPANVLHFVSMEDLIDYLSTMPLSGNTILIKGSRGMQMERIVTYL